MSLHFLSPVNDFLLKKYIANKISGMMNSTANAIYGKTLYDTILPATTDSDSFEKRAIQNRMADMGIIKYILDITLKMPVIPAAAKYIYTVFNKYSYNPCNYIYRFNTLYKIKYINQQHGRNHFLVVGRKSNIQCRKQNTYYKG